MEQVLSSQLSVLSEILLTENRELGTENGKRLGSLFLESFPLMVRPGLAWSHVQPVLENISGCELRATSYEQTGKTWFARSSRLEARSWIASELRDLR
jgi:hypothetical protein